MKSSWLSPQAYPEPRLKERKWLYLPLLLGCLAGASIPHNSAQDELAAGLPNLIPVFAFGLGFIRWWQADHLPITLSEQVAAVGLALLFLFPSTQSSWLLLLLTCAWLYLKSPDAKIRNSLVIIMLAGFQPFLTNYLLKLFAGPVLTTDAILVASLLKFTTGTGSYLGNIIYGPSDHQLLVLRGCSSLTNLGGAWLSWLAIARFKGIPLSAREWVVIGLLSLALISLNLSRLYMMALDIGWHDWWHTDQGLLVYQLLSTLLLFSCIGLGVRYVGLAKKQ